MTRRSCANCDIPLHRGVLLCLDCVRMALVTVGSQAVIAALWWLARLVTLGHP